MAEPLKKPEPTLYDRDFYAWTQEQGARLRGRAAFDGRGDIDWENAAEEIESLGESQRSEIESRLTVLLTHLLKWRFQPEGRSSSWKGSIVEQRGRIRRRLIKSPSLKDYPAEVLAEEYGYARLRAAGETGLPEETFPLECPFTIEEALDPEFYPQAA